MGHLSLFDKVIPAFWGDGRGYQWLLHTLNATHYKQMLNRPRWFEAAFDIAKSLA